MSRCIAVTLALWTFVAGLASAQCVFGSGQLDNFPPAGANTVVLPQINKLICAVNALETRALGMMTQDTACSAVTIAAATETTVVLTGLHPFVGTELVLPTVTDTALPTGLTIVGTATPSGSTVSVAVFNRDAAASHSGRLCVNILRP